MIPFPILETYIFLSPTNRAYVHTSLPTESAADEKRARGERLSESYTCLQNHWRRSSEEHQFFGGSEGRQNGLKKDPLV